MINFNLSVTLISGQKIIRPLTRQNNIFQTIVMTDVINTYLNGKQIKLTNNQHQLGCSPDTQISIISPERIFPPSLQAGFCLKTTPAGSVDAGS